MKLIDKIRVFASDIIANTIATWKFIIIYTAMMLLWVTLHSLDILHIDSHDFIRYNLFLSWAAGIQASIVLMAANRQTEKDRKSLLKGIELDKETLKITENLEKMDVKHHEHTKSISDKVSQLIEKINKLDEIVSLAENEEKELIHEKRKKKK